MKVRIEIDVTPEEARTFLGLPDMAPIHQAFVNEATDKISKAAGLVDIDPLVRTWTGLGGLATDAMGAFLGAATRAASSGSSGAGTSDGKPKTRE